MGIPVQVGQQFRLKWGTIPLECRARLRCDVGQELSTDRKPVPHAHNVSQQGTYWLPKGTVILRHIEWNRAPHQPECQR